YGSGSAKAVRFAEHYKELYLPHLDELMSTSILHRAGKRHAYIVFVDESGFMLAPLPRRTWAPRGCTPIIKIPEPHRRIPVIGAITISPQRRHFSFYFQLSA